MRISSIIAATIALTIFWALVGYPWVVPPLLAGIGWVTGTAARVVHRGRRSR